MSKNATHLTFKVLGNGKLDLINIAALKRFSNKRRKAELQVAPSGNSFAQFSLNDLTA